MSSTSPQVLGLSFAVTLSNHGFGTLQQDLVSACAYYFWCWESASGVKNIPRLGSGPSQPVACVNMNKYVLSSSLMQAWAKVFSLESRSELNVLILLADPEVQGPTCLPVHKSPANCLVPWVLLWSSLRARVYHSLEFATWFSKEALMRRWRMRVMIIIIVNH